MVTFRPPRVAFYFLRSIWHKSFTILVRMLGFAKCPHRPVGLMGGGDRGGVGSLGECPWRRYWDPHPFPSHCWLLHHLR